MSMSQEKTTLLQLYLDKYTPEYRFGFCVLALNKYRFENYPIINNVEITPEDYIVNDSNVRNQIISVIKKEECTEDDFKNIFNILSMDQINYIGF